jgi:hypothetical protein
MLLAAMLLARGGGEGGWGDAEGVERKSAQGEGSANEGRPVCACFTRYRAESSGGRALLGGGQRGGRVPVREGARERGEGGRLEWAALNPRTAEFG